MIKHCYICGDEFDSVDGSGCCKMCERDTEQNEMEWEDMMEDISSKPTAEQIERVWEELEDVPFDEGEKDMILAEDFYIWKAGTGREDIWRWFDENHPLGVAYLLGV